jgi:two-component system chemotaxis response regulator CheY
MEDIKIKLDDIVVSAYQNFLIVDDDDAIRFILEKQLKEIGFVGKILTVSDIHATKRMLKYEKIDFILCDWNLPDHSGASLLKALRKSPKFHDIPFVMVTSNTDVDSMLISKELGGSEYLIKPFAKSDLILKLKNAWNFHTLDTEGRVHQLLIKIKKLEEDNIRLEQELLLVQNK